MSVVMLVLLGVMPALAEDVAPVAVELSFNFEQLAPGHFGMVMISGWDVASAEGVFDGRPVHFHRAGESLVALIAASLDIESQGQFFDATVYLYSGGEVHYHLPVEIAWAGYGQQQINIPSNLDYLLAPELNELEATLLAGVYGRNTHQRFWDGPMELPLDGSFTSPFGVYRTYNGNNLQAYHTGQDISALVGMAVHASETGRVALAEALDIHGNTVILDHGWGVLTAYCHLSEITVTPGQLVQVGEVVGFSGNTGRSTGPHLHWELVVGGTWVDPLSWVSPVLP